MKNNEFYDIRQNQQQQQLHHPAATMASNNKERWTITPNQAQAALNPSHTSESSSCSTSSGLVQLTGGGGAAGAYPMGAVTAASATAASAPKTAANGGGGGGRLGSISDQNKEQYREYKNVKASMNADLKRQQELYEKSVQTRRAEEMRQRQVGSLQ